MSGVEFSTVVETVEFTSVDDPRVVFRYVGTATIEGGGGAVDSVNGETGTVVLAAPDIGYTQTTPADWTTDPEDIGEALDELAARETGGGGAVDSVNGQTGVVVLDAGDVGALPDSTVIPDISGLVADDDVRLSDSRTPTTHAVSHSADGTDPVSILDLNDTDFTDASEGDMLVIDGDGKVGLGQVAEIPTATLYGNNTGSDSPPIPLNASQVRTLLDLGPAPQSFIVAAADASPRAKARADFVCTGTDDDETIEEAVAALPADGGVVELSEGTFHVNPVTLCAPSGGPRTAGGVTLCGQGEATVLRLQSQAASALPSKHGVIQATGTSETLVAGIKVRHLAVDGNRSNISGTRGLDMEGINLVFCVEPVVTDVTVRNAIESGIDFDGSIRGLVLGNRLSGCGGWGIHMSHGATDNRVIGNNVDGCSVEFERGGIDQWGNSPGGNRNVYVGNRVNNSRKNYQIRGSEAVFIGNSSDNGSVADEFTANLTSLGTVAGLDLTPVTPDVPEWVDGDDTDDIDVSVPWQRFTLADDWAPSLSGAPVPPGAASCTLMVVNDGAHTATWPDGILWPSTAPPLVEDETLIVRLTHAPDLGEIAEVLGSYGNAAPGGFNPFDTGTYPTVLHGVWAEDPDWTNPGDGNPVSSWRNESGGGNPANTSTARPVFRASTTAFNNRPTIEFDGSDDYLNCEITDISQPFVVVAVANTGGANSTAEAIVGSGYNGSTRIGDSGGNAWTYNWGTAVAGGTCDGDPHVFVAVINGGSSDLYVDGAVVASGNGGSNSLDRFSLGAHVPGIGSLGQYLDGHIAFAAVYNKSSRDSDITALETALATHYGIA